MVLGEKLFFDWFAGKGTRHFLEDKERMRAARAMGGMPRRPLELTGPGGGMQRASIAPASFPFHGGGMVRPRHQEVIYPPSYDPRRRPCPQHHHPGGGHMYEPRHHRHARHNPRRIERRPYPRGGGRPDYEPDDGMIHGGYHDYDDNLDGSVISSISSSDDDDDDDDEDGHGYDPDITSVGGYSYARHRPRPGRHRGHHHARHPGGGGGGYRGDGVRYGGDPRGYGGHPHRAYGGGPGGYGHHHHHHHHPEEMMSVYGTHTSDGSTY
ncbi:MAG: hypothetical protein LQ349_002678 [Xanthoria aureola]|nr:MAG: hypothetical protein LQ349_002678 [Xanthoria aureola]